MVQNDRIYSLRRVPLRSTRMLAQCFRFKRSAVLAPRPGLVQVCRSKRVSILVPKCRVSTRSQGLQAITSMQRLRIVEALKERAWCGLAGILRGLQEEVVQSTSQVRLSCSTRHGPLWHSLNKGSAHRKCSLASWTRRNCRLRA